MPRTLYIRMSWNFAQKLLQLRTSEVHRLYFVDFTFSIALYQHHDSWLVHKCLIRGWEKSQLQRDETLKHLLHTQHKKKRSKMQFHTWKDFELLHKWKMLQNVHVSSVAFPLHSSVGAPFFLFIFLFIIKPQMGENCNFSMVSIYQYSVCLYSCYAIHWNCNVSQNVWTVRSVIHGCWVLIQNVECQSVCSTTYGTVYFFYLLLKCCL